MSATAEEIVGYFRSIFVHEPLWSEIVAPICDMAAHKFDLRPPVTELMVSIQRAIVWRYTKMSLPVIVTSSEEIFAQIHISLHIELRKQLREDVWHRLWKRYKEYGSWYPLDPSDYLWELSTNAFTANVFNLSGRDIPPEAWWSKFLEHVLPNQMLVHGVFDDSTIHLGKLLSANAIASLYYVVAHRALRESSRIDKLLDLMLQGNYLLGFNREGGPLVLCASV